MLAAWFARRLPDRYVALGLQYCCQAIVGHDATLHAGRLTHCETAWLAVDQVEASLGSGAARVRTQRESLALRGCHAITLAVLTINQAHNFNAVPVVAAIAEQLSKAIR